MNATNDTSAAAEAGPVLSEGLGAGAEELRLADTPITSRGMLWQSNATATLREAAADLARLRAADAALADVAMMLKVCAWALRRGTSPTLGERALVLLTKHGLMGSPLREGTRCTRLSEDGEPCGLEPPCPDCGRACHDVPEGA